MKTIVTNVFKRAAKKLHQNQKAYLQAAIADIQTDVCIGQMKVAGLAGIRVHKFYMLQQLILLAYYYEKSSDSLTLLSFSTHEGFYDRLKNTIHDEYEASRIVTE